MTIPQSLADILEQHVTLQVEGIERMFLSVYIRLLQIVEGVLRFIRPHRGHPVASTCMIEPISREFVAAIEAFVHNHFFPWVRFDKGQHKDEVAARFQAAFSRVSCFKICRNKRGVQ
jgi:hypothetical protein